MNLLKKAYSAVERFFIDNANDQRLMVEAALRRGPSGTSATSLYDSLERTGKTIQAQTLAKWKSAVGSATDPENPDWTALYDLYYNLLLDNHLASVIQSRILFVQRSKFRLVNEAGEEDTALTALMERPWVDELIYKVLYTRFGGRALLELFTLTEDGELAEVREIPQPYFNAVRGIVVKSPGDTTGWSYREGIYADYYVQCGKTDELGMLEQLAPIVLAKKLGMGSWLDYIEKYGVPPLFITTDREDDGRLKQLWEAASRFKSNHFMVGRGREKFEVAQITGTGTSPFDQLIERANNEISKRVLGGSGIADEKAFVGSAEIQFRLAKDRFESDKLFFKYFFNQHIRPRLVKLSPVYKGLEKCTWQWDDTENMSRGEFIDAVVKLGALYDLDPEYITKETGIPILGARYNQPMAAPDQPSGGTGAGKR